MPSDLDIKPSFLVGLVVKLLRTRPHRRLSLTEALSRRLRKAPWIVLITFTLSLVTVWTTYDGPVARFCYDYPFVLAKPPLPSANENMALITLSDSTFQIPGFNRGADGSLDRAHFTKLLHELNRLKPPLIFMDFVFAKSDPNRDPAFGAEIRANSNLVIGAAYVERRTNVTSGSLRSRTLEETSLEPIFPSESLQVPERQVGFLTFRPLDSDQAVRRLKLTVPFDQKARNVPKSVRTAVGRAIDIIGVDKGLPEDTTWTSQWLNYIGPGGTVCPKYTLQEYLADPAKYDAALTNRLIFVGSESTVGVVGTRADAFGNPWSAMGLELMPGVEIHVTAVDNIIRGEWLTRPAEIGEFFLAGLWAAFIGVCFSMTRPKFIFMAAFCLAFFGCVLGILLHRKAYFWFNWIAVWETPLITAALLSAWANRNELGWPVVFISYRRTGGALAHAFRADLALAGKSAWMDERIEAEAFPERLQREIEDAPNFLLLLTGDSVERLSQPNDWMAREIQLAFENKRRVIILDALTEKPLEQRPIPDGPHFARLRDQNNKKYAHEHHSDIVMWVLRELARR